jgi:hypothetical protein
MFYSNVEAKKNNEKSLKLAAIQHQENKTTESTQLADPKVVRGPPVDKHCRTVNWKGLGRNQFCLI